MHSWSPKDELDTRIKTKLNQDSEQYKVNPDDNPQTVDGCSEV